MQRRSPTYKLGLFVIAAVAVLGGLALVFAGGRLDRREIKAYALFEESVQGLEVGSPVKFRGVTVGRVDAIEIVNRDLRVLVLMDLYPDTVGLNTPAQLRHFIEGKVADGAGCRIDWAGITGAKYVEIDFYSTREGAEDVAPLPQPPVPHATFIPSVKSPLAGIAKGVEDVIIELGQVNWQELGENLNGSLVAARQFLEHEDLDRAVDNVNAAISAARQLIEDVHGQLGDQRVQTLLAQSEKTLDQYNELARDARRSIDELEVKRLRQDVDGLLTVYRQVPGDLRQGVTDIKATFARVDTFVADLDKRLDAMELTASAAAFRATLATGKEALAEGKDAFAAGRQTIDEARRTLADLRAVRGDLAAALEQLTRSLDAVERLARTIEEDPSSLLRGKSQPEIRMAPQ